MTIFKQNFRKVGDSILLVALFATGTSLFAQVKAKAKPPKVKAVKEAPVPKVDAGDVATAESRGTDNSARNKTRWSTRGITVGVSGQWVIPKGYIQGKPDEVTLGKENGYSYGARVSLDFNNFWKWFGVFETYDFRLTADQAGATQKYNWGGYRTALGLEMSGQGLGQGNDVFVGWGFGVLVGGGLYIPRTVTQELGDKTIDRSAFANSSVVFARGGLRFFYSFSSGINAGLAYFYDGTLGKTEKARDTGEQIKEINSHNFQVFIDARIFNFGTETYDR